MKKVNFYSGPAMLPQVVLQQAKEAIDNFAGTGLSILEISHRSKEFVKVMEEARALVKELMQLGNDYEVLFLQGGAASQFHMVPINLLGENETASYFDTGQWAHNAMEEAKKFGNVEVACSSADKDYTFIPDKYTVSPQAKYLHITTNNTVYGTQLHWWPKVSCPVVADMSSDIFSREVDYSRFQLIYAGAQKNMGAAGTTLVVVNKDLLGKVDRKIPRMLDYKVAIEKESMLNTPSVFAVYVSWLTLKWIKEQGIAAIEEHNKAKAAVLYEAIDKSKLFKGRVEKKDRSLMNVCFKINDTSISPAEAKKLEEDFLAFAAKSGLVGLKGYRTVGGFRASIYNAMPVSGVESLVQAMEEFEKTKA